MESLSIHAGENAMRAERRQYKRHSVQGRAVFRTTSAVEGTCQPLDVGVGGVLLWSAVVPQEGTELWVHFSFEHAPKPFITLGQVVRARPGGVAVRFLEEPAGLRRTLNSLASRAN